MKDSIQHTKSTAKAVFIMLVLIAALVCMGCLPSFAFADTSETPAELIYESAPDPETNPHPDPSPDPASSEKETGKALSAKTGDMGFTRPAILLLCGTALACFYLVYASNKARKEEQ